VRTFLLLLAVPALLAACNRTPPEPVMTPEPAQPAAQGGGARTDGSRPLTRPTVDIPPGAPPTTLQIQDLVVGTGPEARPGQRVDVQYTGVAWSTRRQFDSSWDRGGEPFSFTLGQGQVIRGWDQGVAGMRVGGRRRLVIPPSLGYGERGAGRDIGPNETLVFVVDLVAVHQ
jgi:peptidylprolyl isomerase